MFYLLNLIFYILHLLYFNILSCLLTGNELTLKCEIHRDALTKVSKCEDFKPISEGGCTMLCNDLMKCGHYCSSICHIYDRKHTTFIICQQPCNR